MVESIERAAEEYDASHFTTLQVGSDAAGLPGQAFVESEWVGEDGTVYVQLYYALSDCSVSSLDLGEPMLPLPQSSHVSWDSAPERAPWDRTSASRMAVVRVPTPCPQHARRCRWHSDDGVRRGRRPRWMRGSQDKILHNLSRQYARCVQRFWLDGSC